MRIYYYITRRTYFLPYECIGYTGRATGFGITTLFWGGGVAAQKNNNEIRSLTGEYKRIEPDCREGVRAQMEHMKALCKERDSLYEKQNDLRGQKQKIEKALER